MVSLIGLRRKTSRILKTQGYSIKRGGKFLLRTDDRGTKRSVHELAKAERLLPHEKFILKNIDIIKPYLIDGRKLHVNKIKPRIIEVETGTKEETIFKWWNLVWWSLPYEHAYGRQMRFLIWDDYHNAPIGLIGLQSPILSWSVRDNYLKIGRKLKDYWVNQSLSAQRIGSLPPYNELLGGKLVTLLMTSDVIPNKFRQKYKDKMTVLMHRKLPPRLLFITTTGAYGKSSVYQRLKYEDMEVAKYIGDTNGSGTFHIPNHLFEEMVKYLQTLNYDVKRGYGSGPSKKMRLIREALHLMGFSNGQNHGVKRAVYLFPLVKNLEKVIQEGKRPAWTHRQVNELTEFWKQRWAIPRAQRKKDYMKFSAEDFIKDTVKNLDYYKSVAMKGLS